MVPARPEWPEDDVSQEPSEINAPRCYPLSAIPSRFARVFPYESFNKIQSSCLYDIWFNKESLVVAAPTGSGKTGILELALCRAWEDFGQSTLAVYMGPTRSLVRERVTDWKNKFGELGVKIVELTGDVDSSNTQPAATEAHLICATPEKWDSHWRTGRKQVSLYLIDEVHSIGEPERGPLLEAVLTRTVVRPRNRKCPPRFVAVSATIANAGDVAKWLGRNVACQVREFDASTKACPVNTLVKGFPCPPEKSSYFFDIGLDFKLPGIIIDHAPRGKSTLVFVSTRKAAVQCAKHLAKVQSWFTVRTLEGSLVELQKNLTDSNLVEVVRHGVAFHHAGLNPRDRLLVEESFMKGIVGVLVTTNTLATGVNFPAYLVVIRGTTMYSGGTTSEYSSSKILQMIGRAGRIQFESSGQAVILTKQQHAARYEALLSGKLENVESLLQQDLMRHLNAEIALGNVKSPVECVDWLKSTFFYVRAEARSMNACKKAEFDVFVEENIRRALQELQAHGIILIERETLCRTALGCAFNRSCLSFSGFSSLMGALRKPAQRSEISPSNLLWLISALPEFGSAQIRSGEKAVLRSLNSKLRSKVTEKPPSWNATHKTFILLQSKLESIDIVDSTSLRLERMSMMKIAKRIARCLSECILILWQHCDLRETIGMRLTFTKIHSISLLAKSCLCEMWYDSKFCAQQLEEIGPTRAQRLVESGYISFDSIAKAEPRMLEIVTHTHPPFGSRLQQQVSNKIPRYLLHWDLIDKAPVITVQLSNREAMHERSSAFVLVGDDNDSVHIFKKLSHDELLRKNVFELEVPPDWQRLRICLINEAIVGVDKDGIMERATSSDAPRYETRDAHPSRPLVIDNRGSCEKYLGCNAWLTEELETATFEESEDALTAIFQARAEELFRDFEIEDSDDRTDEIVASDSSRISAPRDGSPDSLEEILNGLDCGEDALSRERGTIAQEIELPTESQAKVTARRARTPKSRAQKRTKITRSAPVGRATRSAKKPTKTQNKNGPTPMNALGAASYGREECSLVTNCAKPKDSDFDQTSELENPADPRARDTGECERRGRKPALQPQCTAEKDPDDDEWEAYLRETDVILEGILSD